MRSYFALAIAIAMIMTAILSARSDDIPTLDVNPVCRGIATQGELEAGLQQTSFQQCVKSEQDVREQLKKEKKERMVHFYYSRQDSLRYLG